MDIDLPIIIGAGPAGIAAAIQLRRYGISCLVFEKNSIGGLLKNANLVENYPGFPDGIPGIQLVQLIKKHAQQAGVQVTSSNVDSVSYDDSRFVVHLGEQVYRSSTLVIASGTKPRQFTGWKIPAECVDRIYYEVYPLLQTFDRRIAIVGAGDAAFDYALNLGRRNDILILNRGRRRRCLPLLWQRAVATASIDYRENTAITGVLMNEHGGMRLQCFGSAGESEISVDYLIGAIGRDPQIDFLSGTIQERAADLVALGRLYFVGDVTRGLYRQTAIAVGDGVLAAMRIFRYLEEQRL